MLFMFKPRKLFSWGFSVYNLLTNVLLKQSTWKLYFNATVMNPQREADEYLVCGVNVCACKRNENLLLPICEQT